MADIVLGIGTSHTPALTGDGALWLRAASQDRAKGLHNLTNGTWAHFDDLVAGNGSRYENASSSEYVSKQSDLAQQALDRLADEIAAARPDVVLIVGDDHNELFRSGVNPSFAIYCGNEVVMFPWGKSDPTMPPFFDQVLVGCAMDDAHRFPGDPVVAKALVDHLTDAGVDTAVVTQIEDASKGGVGHASGFVVERLFRGARIPIVPLLLNTYYPPNVMRPGRCYEVGRALAAAIKAMPAHLRVAVVASGGLSHTVTDDEYDRALLEALRTNDLEFFRKLPVQGLIDGTSEVLCWILVGGAMEGLKQAWCEYFPIRRTLAGTGVGVAFTAWRPAVKGSR